MNELDQEIRNALTAEERQLFDRLGDEMSMNELMLAPFQTRLRWWSVWVFVMTFVFAIAGFWTGYHFFTESGVEERVFWGFLTLMAWLAVAMLKMWFFMEMNKISIIRELRRVQLHLARGSRE